MGRPLDALYSPTGGRFHPLAHAEERTTLLPLLSRGVSHARSVEIRLDLGQSMPSTMRKSRSTPSERATIASW
jgi:hypothetical protein